MSLSPGDVIDNKYQIVRLLGEGGMGAVFEGENTRIKRRVAIKVLHAAVADNAEAAERFQREAQAAGHIGNEHIIEVLDLGELPNGDRFMVMEYLDGEPMSDRIKRMGHLTPEQAVPIFTQILQGLAAAHQAGILHRDLKPDNIYILNEKVGHKDFVKIIDFGISKFQPLSDEMKMTRTGTIMGTPYYMSPEQASGARAMNAQSDIYAVGVILYEALTGAVPFDAPTFNQLMFQIVLSEPAPIDQIIPDLDPAFASIVRKAMARDQSHRFESCDEFRLALESWSASGAGVTVPPINAGDVYLPQNSGVGTGPGAARAAAELAATGLAVPGQPPGAAFSRTNQAWANTQGPVATPEPKRNKLPLIVGAASGALLLLGGVSFALMSGSEDAVVGAPGAPAAVETIATPPADPVSEPSPVEEAEGATAKTADETSAANEADDTAEDKAEDEAEKENEADPEALADSDGDDEVAAPSASGAAPVAKPVPRIRRIPQKKVAPKPKRRDFGY